MVINYNLEDNKIFIKYDDKLNSIVSIYKWEPISNDISLLYETVAIFNNNELWFSPGLKLKDLKGIKIQIKVSNKIFKDEYFIFDTIFEQYKEYTNILFNKPVSIYIEKDLGLGDIMWISPLIRKLHHIYNKKIKIYGHNKYKEFFKNNPYITSFHNKYEYDLIFIENENENFNVFTDSGIQYFYSDLRQLAAKSAGITLKEDELELDYIPDEYIDIPELPKDYILINPRNDSECRKLSYNDWQTIIDLLNDKGIPVVTIGVGPSAHHTDLKIKNGLNLVFDEKQNSLSQTWHIINKSKIFVTFDTGIYVFAGTTNTELLLIGWNCDPWFHQPYRNGGRNYKWSTVRGNCPFYCTTDPRTNLVKLNSIKNLYITDSCALNINYKCLPSPHQIFEKIIEKYG